MFVVIFEVQPHADQMEQYLDFAKLLRPELEQIHGFIDNERFASAQHTGRILSLSTWRDEKALIRWRTHAQHHHVQEQGRTLVFAGYRLRVGEVIADTQPPSAHAVHQQRFDTTETSRAKAISLVELGVPAGDAPKTARAANAIASEDFTGISRPGQRITLTEWSDADTARAWHADHNASNPHPSVRSRIVRVIRAYGMADRGEAPQYYPATAPDAVMW